MRVTKLNRADYNKQMKEIDGRGKKILLHVCCAPCSAGVLPRLEGFVLSPYFYNPNIDTREEYELRAAQFEKLGIVPAVEAYNHAEFLFAVKDKENEPEGGSRCKICIAMRLEKAAQRAKETGADFFCSTLSVSPHKDAQFINATGQKLAEKYGVAFLPNDFKKENGFLLSTERSKEMGLYRQNYCGCEFAKRIE